MINIEVDMDKQKIVSVATTPIYNEDAIKISFHLDTHHIVLNMSLNQCMHLYEKLREIF